MRTVAFAAAIVCMALAAPAKADEVVSRGAPRSAPACHDKADLLALVVAISRHDAAAVKNLTSNARCWGVWDGSIGNVIEHDERSGLSLVTFSTLAKLPAGRRETLWIETRYLSAHD